MIGLLRRGRVPCRCPEGGRTCLWVRALPGEKVALVDADGADIAVLEPLEVGRLRGALRAAAIHALWPPERAEWDGREDTIGWPVS